MTDIFRVRVQRSKVPFYGIFGPEYWWEVRVGLNAIAMLRHWSDAQVIARLVHVGIQKTRGGT